MIYILLSFVLAQASATPAPDGPAAPATVRGRVTDKQTGAPITGAIVRLGKMNPNEPWPTPARTDTDGRFQFSGLTPGIYSGSVSDDQHHLVHTKYWMFRETPGEAVLKPGETRDNVDVALERTFAIPVRVTDEAGAPLAGVSVQAATPTERLSPGAMGYQGTDDQGRRRLFQLPPGRYIVCAEPPRRDDDGLPNQERFLKTCYPSAISEGEAQIVRLIDRDAAEIELRLRRGRTYTISGLVLTARGVPAGNVMVSVSEYSPRGSLWRGVSRSADGRFSVRNLPPGDYTVGVRSGGPDQLQDRAPLEIGYTPVTVSSADIEDLVVAMKRTVDVPGRFVIDDTDVPFPKPYGDGLMLMARLADEHLPGQGSHVSATAGEDLAFQLKGIFGKRRFSAANVPAGWYLKAVRYAGKDVTDEGVELKAETTPETFEVVLSHRGPTIAGRITDALGNPVARASIYILPANVTHRSPFESPVYETQSAAYRVGPTRPGDYIVVALDPRSPYIYPGDHQRLQELAKSGERISLGDNEDRILDLTAILIER